MFAEPESSFFFASASYFFHIFLKFKKFLELFKVQCCLAKGIPIPFQFLMWCDSKFSVADGGQTFEVSTFHDFDDK